MHNCRFCNAQTTSVRDVDVLTFCVYEIYKLIKITSGNRSATTPATNKCTVLKERAGRAAPAVIITGNVVLLPKKNYKLMFAGCWLGIVLLEAEVY